MTGFSDFAALRAALKVAESPPLNLMHVAVDGDETDEAALKEAEAFAVIHRAALSLLPKTEPAWQVRHNGRRDEGDGGMYPRVKNFRDREFVGDGRWAALNHATRHAVTLLEDNYADVNLERVEVDVA